MNEPAVADKPGYLDAWSLRCHPFENRLDPQFFYAGSSLMQRLDLLTHLVQFGESVVIVSGPEGSGKSSLLEQFLGHINPQWAICLMDGEWGEPLSAKLAETIGTSPDDDEQALLARWAAQSDATQHMVILVDNAEHLDDDACLQLCKLTSLPDSDRLRIVLFGTTDTEQRVRTTLEQLNSKRNSQTLEIPRLTEEETASYLMYRLAVAGYSGESPFTPTEVRAICKAAEGRPGGINVLAHESMIEHHLRAKNKKRAPVSRGPKKNNTPIWVAASLAIAVLTGYLGWQRLAPTTESDQGSEPPALAIAELSLELPATPQPAKDADSATEQPGEPVAAEGPEIQPTDTPLVQPESILPPRHEPVPETGSTVVPAEKRALPSSLSKPEPGEPLKPLDPGLRRDDDIQGIESTAEVAVNTATLPDPVDKPESASAQKTSPAATPGLPHREDWLLKQQPTTFTLQLLGSREQSSIATYVKQHALDPAKTAYYRGRYRDADWYVLLYGIYPDKVAALAARSTLPTKVQKGKPWSRSLKSVQDSINEAP